MFRGCIFMLFLKVDGEYTRGGLHSLKQTVPWKSLLASSKLLLYHLTAINISRLGTQKAYHHGQRQIVKWL